MGWTGNEDCLYLLIQKFLWSGGHRLVLSAPLPTLYGLSPLECCERTYCPVLSLAWEISVHIKCIPFPVLSANPGTSFLVAHKLHFQNDQEN